MSDKCNHTFKIIQTERFDISPYAKDIISKIHNYTHITPNEKEELIQDLSKLGIIIVQQCSKCSKISLPITYLQEEN